MKKHLLALMVIGITMLLAAAGTAATLFGPIQYTRSNGEPDAYTDSFEAVPGEYYLFVRNGDENGNNRISSASIYINDDLIFEPNDFHHYTDILKAPVQLSEINTITVNLGSTPGAYLTVEIRTYCPLIFGPGQFVRTTGKPNTYTETFIATPGEGFLTILNGDENGGDRVTSASIYVNGLKIFEPKDFKNKDYILAADVDLSATNTITVELAGSPGSYLNIEFCQKPPTVDLTVTPDTIIEGQSAELSWVSAFALNASIDNGIGEVNLTGSVTVTPSETTTYTITAANVGASASESVTLTVIPLPKVTLTAAPPTIIEGQTFDLSWVSEHSDSVVIDNGIGEVASSGSIPLSPIVDTTYTITATGPGGTVQSSVTVIVIPLPRVNITAMPETIIYGQTSTISWTAENADSVVIDSGIGEVALTGSMPVSPVTTTTYTITATGPGGTASADVTITVFYPPTTDIRASSDTIMIGASTQLSWTSEHADTVVIDNGIGPVQPSGSRTVNPTETTTYTITATGPGGVAVDTVTVTVITLPVISMTATSRAINAGESIVLTWAISYAESATAQQSYPSGSAPEEIPLSGESTLTPDRTTTYTITAAGPGGTATQSLTVEVTVPPPVVTLFVNPPVITPGSAALLSWESGFADTCIITPDIGQVAVDGLMEITPDRATTYTITATGPGGTAVATATVSVEASPPLVMFTATPTDIGSGESVTLSWQTFLADSCEITADTGPVIGPVDPSGSMSVTPAGTTIYTLAAAGPGGTVSKSVTIRIPDVDLAPVRVDASGSVTDGQTLAISGTVDVDIKNNGTRTINEDFAVTLFEDMDQNVVFDAGADNILGNQTLPSGPAPGETLSVTIPVNAVMRFADNRIFAFVDSSDSIRESNETNNITHSMADCEYHPPVGSFNPVVEWQWTGSPIKPTSNQVASAPVVINLTDDNGDGKVNDQDIPDIIFNSYVRNSYKTNGTLRVLSGNGSGEIFSITQYDTNPSCNPAVGDIDGDGLPEILAVTETCNVIAFENDGSFKWQNNVTIEGSSLDSKYYPSVTLADLDADGSPEVIAGKVVINCDGSTKWVGTSGYGLNTSCVANLDLEGSPELVAGITAYRADGEIYWTNSELKGGFTAVGNLDDDPYPEIVYSGTGYICAAEHNGQKKWGPISLPGGGNGGPPTIADFDNDGEPEIGIAGEEKYVVFEADGTVKWTSPTSDYSSSATGSSVFDFEGDGCAEAIYGDEYFLRIYRGTDGAVLYQHPLGSRTRLELPVIADVDNDNNAEIVAVSSNDIYTDQKNHGIFVFGDADDTWVNTRKIWNQHAYHITNVNDDGTIPRFEANNWETYNNYRQNEMLNPFGCIDLSASMIRVNRTGIPDSVGLVVRVGNAGVLHVNAGANVSFYNGDPESSGVLLGTVQTPARLNPGQYADLTLQWNQPPIDIYTIYVKVDDDGTGAGKISESNETNNTAVSQINLGNQAPVADAGPDRTVFINDPATLDGGGSSDPENKPITFSWEMISKPSGSSAVLENPDTVGPAFTADLAGEYMLQLVVNDGVLDSGIDMVTITASPPVTVPDLSGLTQSQAISAINAAGLSEGSIDKSFSDTVAEGKVTAQSPAPGSITFLNAAVNLTLSKGVRMVVVPDVSGMTAADAAAALAAVSLTTGETIDEYIDIQPAGRVFYQSEPAGSIIPHDSAVDLKISKGVWTGPDTQPPYVWITVNPAQVNINQPVSIRVTAADNVGVTATHLTINGQAIPLTNGQAAYLPRTGGYFTARATATDAAGLTGTADAVFTVINPNDTIPPVVSLDETDCADVTDLTSVTGRVYDNGGVAYTLSYRAQGTTAWKPFADGSGVNITGALGTFDPTVLKNGVYEILLSARDLAGNTAHALGCALVDGQLKAGQVNLPAMDVSLPENGFPLSLEREYDSREPDGDFGPGWSLPSLKIKPQTTRDLNGGWAEEVGGNFLTTYYLIEKYRHVAVIRFSDEEMIKFRMDVTPKSSVLVPIQNHTNLSARFVPIDGTVGKLEALGVANGHLMLIGNQLMEWGTDPYKPTRYKYTKPDGTAYVLNTATGIESVTDVYGHTVTYSASGITHSSGASISITRGTGNRIETITDPLGQIIEYYYDADGMLEKVVKSGNEPVAMRMMSNYAYARGIFEKPVLKDIKAPDGTVLGQFEYDAKGRMTALIDADGNKIIYGFDVPNHTQEITDRRGNTSVYEYNNKGYVTQKIDPDGHVSTWTYDDQGNKLSETDPLGSAKAFTYDATGNMLTETDALGNTTTYTYNNRKDVLTQTDPLGRMTTYTYDSLGNKLTETDPIGNTKTFTHDAHGNVLTETNALGHVTTFAYDANGNKISEISPSGKTTAWTYDRYGNELTESVTRTTDAGIVAMTTTNTYDIRNRLTRTVDAMGNETRTQYNYLDKESAVIDKTGARTEFEYDANGNQAAIHYADATSALTAYDPDGNRTSSTDRDGRITQFEYDANNQLVRVVHPDGAESGMVFDNAGRMTATVDENGNETRFDYDNAGRRVKVTDAIGNEIPFNYDAAGNQTAMTDPKGAVTRYEYDGANRQVKTIHPDGTFTQTGYDALGRKTSETDPSGRSTLFGYDAAGNLTTVTDALNGITDYTYDEVGNRISHIDPNGHTETWKYDDLGRVMEHTLPLGMTESYTYDGNGNMLSHTDFKGETTQYEYSPCCGRLTRKVYPDSSTVSFTYSGTGLRQSVTDARGETQYAYDSRGRLEQVTNPDGGIISYTYDPKGNRTSVTVPSGTTAYAFDELNRLAIVTDPDGGVTAYAYDANGNRKTVTYPNGTSAEYSYDTQNRLIYLENRTSTGDVITSYQYTLDPAGNRTKVTENTGRVVNYNYDDVYRLTAETITDSAAGNAATTYIYDAAGNRLSKTDGTGTTTYTYDANDRLTTESTPGVSYVYSYDANGNTTGKTGNSETITYAYDPENRLTNLTTPTSQVQYAYDPDGIRVEQTIDGAQTLFIVDKNRDYAQVLEERDNLGSLTTGYVYGDDLISQERGGVESYYHYDGLGSTRALTNSAGTATDSYIYEAFGGMTNSTGTTQNNYKFTGEQYDPNAEFYYLRARYYDPGVGRFVTRDSFEGYDDDPVTLHKYLYTANNPVMYVDPNGEFFFGLMGNLSIGIRHYGLTIAASGQFMFSVTRLTVRYGAANIRSLITTGQLYSTRLLQIANAQYPRLVGKEHLHHIIPKYICNALGIPIHQVVVSVPAPIHQYFTNAIRVAFPFGNALKYHRQLPQIMNELLRAYERAIFPK